MIILCTKNHWYWFGFVGFISKWNDNQFFDSLCRADDSKINCLTNITCEPVT